MRPALPSLCLSHKQRAAGQRQPRLQRAGSERYPAGCAAGVSPGPEPGQRQQPPAVHHGARALH
ncbi:hypothetical protein HaLaN_05133 [Haematococcus lacustris]|uniref:Uncharacterized protein n=1 Tax=Haematococcus lacustris TaxID=44745 RepID=A0A699YI86_HAELA|nr:hypothetical protein HaLaN_05133 [Haematococcus lacustris]